MVTNEIGSSALEQSASQLEQVSRPSSPSETLLQAPAPDLMADTNETIQAQDEATYQRRSRKLLAHDSSTPIPATSTTDEDNEDPDTAGASTNLIPPDTIEARKLCQKPTWRPFWLQRSTLIAFSGFFFGSAIALLSMLAYSQKSKGLTVVRMELANLWRFGPPAVLTAVATLWARVEFQTLRYFPWMTVHKENLSGHRITSLDYTSLILPKVIVLSLKRKDFLVCLVSVLAILMKAQVVLSASLFYNEDVESSFPLEIELLDSFQTTKMPNPGYNSASYFAARAFHDFHMNLPFGITEQAAYQTFKPVGSDTGTRGTSDMPITVTVDALFTDIQCLPMKGFESSLTPLPKGRRGQLVYNFTFDVLFEGCDRPVRVGNRGMWLFSQVQPGYWMIKTIKETPSPCPSLPTQFPPFVYLGHLEKPSETNRSIPVVEKCAAAICAPTAWVTKVEVIDNGIEPVLRLLPGQEVTEVVSNPWSLLTNITPPLVGGWNIDDGPSANQAGPLSVDSMWFGMNGANVTDKSLYQNERLIGAVQNLTKALGPFISNAHLRGNGKSSTIGVKNRGNSKAEGGPKDLHCYGCYLHCFGSGCRLGSD
ncbi:unnamed protein product [Clonostachys rosea]|uniref:Uncharacterized protein n=1 Tax=Bionectria ochroleuca TaxID=29856 RepID=A0ABY6V287_BIOOC|nr:unnamed protein product [Clonostachys rosea]